MKKHLLPCHNLAITLVPELLNCNLLITFKIFSSDSMQSPFSLNIRLLFHRYSSQNVNGQSLMVALLQLLRSQLIGYLDPGKWHCQKNSHHYTPGNEQPAIQEKGNRGELIGQVGENNEVMGQKTHTTYLSRLQREPNDPCKTV